MHSLPIICFRISRQTLFKLLILLCLLWLKVMGLYLEHGARVTSYIASATDVVAVVGAPARSEAVGPAPAGDCTRGQGEEGAAN